MMRRGPTDQYPIEMMLHEAAVGQISGSIELNTEPAATFYLDHGRVYFAVAEVIAGMHEPVAPSTPQGDVALRAHIVEVLRSTWGPRPGFYFHDPLAHQIDDDKASWAVDELLAEARHVMNEQDLVHRWTGVTVGMTPPTRPDAQLSGDCWQVLAAMSDPRSTAELAHRLRWDDRRLGATLEALCQHGVLDTDQAMPRASRQRSTQPEPGAQQVRPQQPAQLRPTGPLPTGAHHAPGAPSGIVPAPANLAAPEDRRGALRRLIGSLRGP